jgi:hypothetical protein
MKIRTAQGPFVASWPILKGVPHGAERATKSDEKQVDAKIRRASNGGGDRPQDDPAEAGAQQSAQ